MTLYDLTAEYMRLLEIAEDPEADPEALTDTMEALTGEIEYKAEGYVCVIKKLEAQSDMFGKEIERLGKAKSGIDNNIKRIKERLLMAMQAIGKPKINTEHFKISIAKNGGVQPMKITGDVPKGFQVIEFKPDMNRIRELLSKGFELDFAHLEERGQHLNIR